jgi:hypothetical protein
MEGAPSLGSDRKPKRAPTPEEVVALQAEWDKKLAEENLHAEPTPEFEQEQESEAYKTAVRDACLYFLNTGNTADSWGAHRQKLQEFLSQLRASGASEHEIESFDEDFLRSIEDQMAQLVVTARAEMDEIAKNESNLSLSVRPEVLSKRVVSQLAKMTPWPREVLQSAADQAAGVGFH